MNRPIIFIELVRNNCFLGNGGLPKIRLVQNEKMSIDLRLR